MSLPIRFVALTALAVTVAAPSLLWAQRPATVDERLQGADAVVVGRAHPLRARWRTNDRGDRLIISEVAVQVEETLKGTPGPVVLELEGGTVDGVTMRVSSLPMLDEGERAVFFLHRGNATFTPHLRGQGILKLQDDDVVKGTSLDLSQIRGAARRASRGEVR